MSYDDCSDKYNVYNMEGVDFKLYGHEDECHGDHAVHTHCAKDRQLAEEPEHAPRVLVPLLQLD